MAMMVDCCEAPSCGNLAAWRFTTQVFTVCVCTYHAAEIEASGRAWPEWAGPSRSTSNVLDLPKVA